MFFEIPALRTFLRNTKAFLRMCSNEVDSNKLLSNITRKLLYGNVWVDDFSSILFLDVTSNIRQPESTPIFTGFPEPSAYWG